MYRVKLNHFLQYHSVVSSHTAGLEHPVSDAVLFFDDVKSVPLLSSRIHVCVSKLGEELCAIHACGSRGNIINY